MKAKELLDENYRLRRELDRINYNNTKNLIKLLELIRDSKNYDVGLLIDGFKSELENLK